MEPEVEPARKFKVKVIKDNNQPPDMIYRLKSNLLEVGSSNSSVEHSEPPATLQAIEPQDKATPLEESGSELLKDNSSLLDTTPESQAGEPLVDQDTLSVNDGSSLLVVTSEPPTEEAVGEEVVGEEVVGEAASAGEPEEEVAVGSPLVAISEPIVDYDKEELGRMLREGLTAIAVAADEPATVEATTTKPLKPLTSLGLEKRLKRDNATISRNKSKGAEHFRKWSKGVDPDGVAWEFRAGKSRSPQYHPLV